MRAPRLPAEESSRLQALRRYDLLDTLPERDLDDLTSLASQICEAPIALISLIDERRQWFKSRIGLSASETSRDISFCGHAILQADLFVVEDALSDERLRVVTENARVGLVLVDQDRRYAYANHAYAEILDLPSSEIVGLGVADVLASVFDEQIRPRLDRAFAGERVGYDLSRHSAEGERSHSVRYEPTSLAGFGPLVAVVITDDTEHRRAEDARWASELLYLTLFDYAPDGILIADGAGRYIDANASMCRMLGYSREELIGLDESDIVSASELEHIEPAMRSIKASADYRREWMFRRK